MNLKTSSDVRGADVLASEVPLARRHDLLAGVACLLMLCLALVLGHFHRVGNFGVETDFYGTYVVQAGNILRGEPYTYRHNPPGYCLMLVAATAVTGDAFVAGKFLSALAATLLSGMSYLLLRAFFDSRIALAGTILLQLALIPFSFIASTDLVGAAAVMLPLWLFFRVRETTWRTCLLVGLATGGALLVRSNAIFVPIGVLCLLWLAPGSSPTWSKRIINSAAFAGAVAIIMAPWLYYNWKQNGSAMASTAHLQVAAHFYHPEGDHYITALREMATRFGSMSEVLLADPLRVVRAYLRDVLYLNPANLVKEGLYFPANVLAGGGVLLLLARRPPPLLAALFVAALGYLVLGLVGFYVRYYLFLFPFLYVMVASFLFDESTVARLGRLPWRGVPVSGLVFAVVAAFGALHAARDFKMTVASEPRYLIEMAETLKPRVAPGDSMISRKPHLPRLVGVPSHDFPLARTAGEFLDKARTLGARYIVYSTADAVRWEGLESLSNPDTVPRAFTLVATHAESGTLVYEIDLSLP